MYMVHFTHACSTVEVAPLYGRQLHFYMCLVCIRHALHFEIFEPPPPPPPPPPIIFPAHFVLSKHMRRYPGAAAGGGGGGLLAYPWPAHVAAHANTYAHRAQVMM